MYIINDKIILYKIENEYDKNNENWLVNNNFSNIDKNPDNNEINNNNKDSRLIKNEDENNTENESLINNLY